MTNTMGDLEAKFNKEFGDMTAERGDVIHNISRIETGVFPLDLAMGGGFPRGKISCIFGPENSGKTLLALKLIAHYQKTHPDRVCVWVDVENNHTPEWAEALGVDTKSLIVLTPDYAEQAVDMVEASLHSEDLGLIVLDSLGAMVTMLESESSAEKVMVGGNSLVVGKLARKCTLALSKMKKVNRFPSLVCINQIRFKIGGYGNPEHMPGGSTFKHACSLILRLYGKNVIDSKVHPAIPARSEVDCIITKYKFFIAARVAKYGVNLIAHNDRPIGYINEWPTMVVYLKKGQFLGKSAKGPGWVCMGEEYKTLASIYDRVTAEPEYEKKLKDTIFEYSRTPDFEV